MWRQAMQEPLPLYFNEDGTRTNAAERSRNVSPMASIHSPENKTAEPVLNQVGLLQTAEFTNTPL